MDNIRQKISLIEVYMLTRVKYICICIHLILCIIICPRESEETLIQKKSWPNPNLIETLTLILFLPVARSYKLLAVPWKWLNNSLVSCSLLLVIQRTHLFIIVQKNCMRISSLTLSLRNQWMDGKNATLNFYDHEKCIISKGIRFVSSG